MSVAAESCPVDCSTEPPPRNDALLRAVPQRRSIARWDQLEAARGVLVPAASPDLGAMLLREGIAVTLHDGAGPVPAVGNLDAIVVDAASWTAEAWRGWRARQGMEGVPA